MQGKYHVKHHMQRRHNEDNKVKGASASRDKRSVMEMKGRKHKVENGREDVRRGEKMQDGTAKISRVDVGVWRTCCYHLSAYSGSSPYDGDITPAGKEKIKTCSDLCAFLQRQKSVTKCLNWRFILTESSNECENMITAKLKTKKIHRSCTLVCLIYGVWPGPDTFTAEETANNNTAKALSNVS